MSHSRFPSRSVLLVLGPRAAPDFWSVIPDAPVGLVSTFAFGTLHSTRPPAGLVQSWPELPLSCWASWSETLSAQLAMSEATFWSQDTGSGSSAHLSAARLYRCQEQAAGTHGLLTVRVFSLVWDKNACGSGVSLFLPRKCSFFFLFPAITFGNHLWDGANNSLFFPLTFPTRPFWMS